MGNVPIEPEGTGGFQRADLNALLKQVQAVPTPLLVTITTLTECYVVGNVPMKSLDAFEKAHIYMLHNAMLLEELAEWEQDRQDGEIDGAKPPE